MKTIEVQRPEDYAKLLAAGHSPYGEAEIAAIWAQTEPVTVPEYEPIEACIRNSLARYAETMAKHAKDWGDEAAKLEMLP